MKITESKLRKIIRTEIRKLREASVSTTTMHGARKRKGTGDSKKTVKAKDTLTKHKAAEPAKTTKKGIPNPKWKDWDRDRGDYEQDTEDAEDTDQTEEEPQPTTPPQTGGGPAGRGRGKKGKGGGDEEE